MDIYVPNSLIASLERVIARARPKGDDERRAVEAARAGIAREKQLDSWQRFESGHRAVEPAHRATRKKRSTRR